MTCNFAFAKYVLKIAKTKNDFGAVKFMHIKPLGYGKGKLVLMAKHK